MLIDWLELVAWLVIFGLLVVFFTCSCGVCLPSAQSFFSRSPASAGCWHFSLFVSDMTVFETPKFLTMLMYGLLEYTTHKHKRLWRPQTPLFNFGVRNERPRCQVRDGGGRREEKCGRAAGVDLLYVSLFHCFECLATKLSSWTCPGRVTKMAGYSYFSRGCV